MNADEHRYKHAAVTRRIIKVFFEVYNELGGGFAESVYHRAMRIALEEGGLAIEAEVPLAVHFRGRVVGEFRADLVVAGRVLVELKAVSALDQVHEAQVLNYLRCGALEVGLLPNFGPRAQIRRLLLTNDIKMNPGRSPVHLS